MKKILALLFSCFLVQVSVGQITRLSQTNSLYIKSGIINDSLIFKKNFDDQYLRTTDGGLSFDTLQNISEPTWDIYFSFFDDRIGFVTTKNSSGNGSILKTTDGGLNWATTNAPIINVLYSTIYTYGKDSVLTVTEGGTIYKTIDGGDTWNTVTQPTLQSSSSSNDKLKINTNGFGIFQQSRNRSKFYVTANFGDTWIENIIPIDLEDHDLYALDANGRYVTAVCSSFVSLLIVCSSDYGETWNLNEFSIPIVNTWYVSITSSNSVYTSLRIWEGDFVQATYKLENNLDCFSTITNQEEVSKGQLKIYPNPSNGIFTIETNSNENYSIYDVTGKLILSSNENNLDLSNQLRGVYFLKINSDKNEVIKLIKK